MSAKVTAAVNADTMLEKPSCLAPLVMVGYGLLLDPEGPAPEDAVGELPELPDALPFCTEVISAGTFILPALAKLTPPSWLRVSGLAARNVRVYLGIHDQTKFLDVAHATHITFSAMYCWAH